MIRKGARLQSLLCTQIPQDGIYDDTSDALSSQCSGDGYQRPRSCGCCEYCGRNRIAYGEGIRASHADRRDQRSNYATQQLSRCHHRPTSYRARRAGSLASRCPAPILRWHFRSSGNGACFAFARGTHDEQYDTLHIQGIIRHEVSGLEQGSAHMARHASRPPIDRSLCVLTTLVARSL